MVKVICRTCTVEENFEDEDNLGNLLTFWNLFDQILLCGKLCSPAEIIDTCYSLSVTKDEGSPDEICKKCIEKLSKAYEFKLLCEKSFQSFSSIKVEKVEDGLEGNVSTKLDVKSEIEDDDFKDEECSNFSTENSIRDFDETLYEEDSKNAKQKKVGRPKMFKKQYMCNVCEKYFRTMVLLIAHQDSHLGIKRYFCQICQKAYRVEKDHVLMHKRGSNHKCDLCLKSFNSKSKLVNHKVTHEKNRERISCDIEGCSKTFLSIGGLDRHKVFHAGIKEFICHLCSKSFMDKYQLEIHIRSHTNERPYSCTYCSKKFNTSSGKTSHERWHKDDRNHNCQYCGKGFVNSSGLKRHLLCHTKSQELECRFCGKKFIRLDHKKRHEMAIHGFTEHASIQKSEIL